MSEYFHSAGLKLVKAIVRFKCTSTPSTIPRPVPQPPKPPTPLCVTFQRLSFCPSSGLKWREEISIVTLKSVPLAGEVSGREQFDFSARDNRCTVNVKNVTTKSLNFRYMFFSLVFGFFSHCWPSCRFCAEIVLSASTDPFSPFLEGQFLLLSWQRFF